MKHPYDKAGTWEVLRLGFRLFVLTLTVALAAAGCAALFGCSGFKGGVSRVDAVGVVDSERRHELGGIVGPRVTWGGGAELEVLGGASGPVYWPGEPQTSSRAPSSEFNLRATCRVPLWARD